MKTSSFNDKIGRVLQINKNQLKQFYEKCQKDKLIGIDTEFYRVDTYYPKLCLIQLANNSESIFLDPLTHDLDYKLLKKLLFNTRIKKIFHAARQDIEIFFNIYKKIPVPVHDIQIYLEQLGYNQSVSYAKACKDLLNIEISKNNQFIDWRVRPLDSNKIQYALNDVKHLIPIFKIIKKKLKIENFKQIRFQHQKIININIYAEKINNAWEKLKFKPRNRFELNKLKKYSSLREKIAIKKDVPVRRVASDKEITLICKQNIDKEIKKKIMLKLNIKKIY